MKLRILSYDLQTQFFDSLNRLVPRTQKQIIKQMLKFEGLVEEERKLREEASMHPATAAMSRRRECLCAKERDYFGSKVKRRVVSA